MSGSKYTLCVYLRKNQSPFSLVDYTPLHLTPPPHLRLVDAECLEELRVFDWQLYHLLYLLDLFVQTPHHVIG